MRLDKYLSDAGVGTRRECKELCRKKSVTVNGVVVTRPETALDPRKDTVCIKGEPVTYSEYIYYMFHKPAGVVTAVTDKREKTVVDLITESKRKDLFPVGRLDRDTEGLLLITNDGALCHRLLSPRHHVEKTYFAKVKGRVLPEHVTAFSQGVNIGDENLTRPAKLKILDSGEESQILLTITEGRFHQVKRMFQAVGCEVTYLKRISMGPLQLDEELRPGEYRCCTAEEIEALMTTMDKEI